MKNVKIFDLSFYEHVGEISPIYLEVRWSMSIFGLLDIAESYSRCHVPVWTPDYNISPLCSLLFLTLGIRSFFSFCLFSEYEILSEFGGTKICQKLSEDVEQRLGISPFPPALAYIARQVCVFGWVGSFSSRAILALSSQLCIHYTWNTVLWTFRRKMKMQNPNS